MFSPPPPPSPSLRAAWTVRPGNAGEPPARDLVVIGAAGAAGLRELCDLLGALPEGLPAAVLVVLHGPADQASALREIIARRSRLPVRIARTGESLRPGRCYMGEPGRQLSVGPGRTARLTSLRQLRNGTIDLLFESAARDAGARTIGVILSGSLKDGSVGLAEVGRAGGVALVRTPAGRVGGDLPRAAIAEAGAPDLVGSTEQIAQAIVRLTGAVGPSRAT